MIEIYTKNGCIFCTQAKELLKENGKEFFEYKLGQDFTREHCLTKFPEAKTYPIIVIDGMNIGGYDQLVRQLQEEASDTRKILLEDGGLEGLA